MILYKRKGFCSSPPFSNFVPLGIFKFVILFGSVKFCFWEPYFTFFFFLKADSFSLAIYGVFLGLNLNSSININELLDEIEVEVGV